MRKKEKRILCPRCEYKPRPDDRWSCLPRCATLWHTFWTGGVCPGCGLRWPLTQCPSCGAVSPHKQWYREPAPGREQRRQRERTPESVA